MRAWIHYKQCNGYNRRHNPSCVLYEGNTWKMFTSVWGGIQEPLQKTFERVYFECLVSRT